MSEGLLYKVVMSALFVLNFTVVSRKLMSVLLDS